MKDIFREGIRLSKGSNGSWSVYIKRYFKPDALTTSSYRAIERCMHLKEATELNSKTALTYEGFVARGTSVVHHLYIERDTSSHKL